MSNGMWAQIQQVYYDIRFFEQLRGDARRTVYCHADDAERIREGMRERGLDDIVTVTVSPLVKAGQMLVADTAALDAALAENLQKMTRRPLL